MIVEALATVTAGSGDQATAADMWIAARRLGNAVSNLPDGAWILDMDYGQAERDVLSGLITRYRDGRHVDDNAREDFDYTTSKLEHSLFDGYGSGPSAWERAWSGLNHTIDLVERITAGLDRNQAASHRSVPMPTASAPPRRAAHTPNPTL